MKILIMGMGHIGKALAEQLKHAGHWVAGTTTTPEKVDALSALVDEVHLLKGEQADLVTQAAKDCDLVVITVAPNVRNTRTPEEREKHYHQVLELSCKHAAAACARTLFLSSFSVYGDGGQGDSPITEQTATANHDEPSSKYYQRAEQAVLESRAGCVLRFPDMYGAPGDLSFTERVKMAQEYFGGKILFGPDAPLYAIHFEDVVNAVMHAISNDLRGVFNVCDNQRTPATNKQVFDGICDQQEWPRLVFLNQIKAPNRKISAEKIYATGYQTHHPDPNADFGDSA